MGRFSSFLYSRGKEIYGKTSKERQGLFLWQTAFLTIIDGFTNLIDYVFHIYLARVLLSADFAVVQTVNTAFLILITAFAIFQPTVARYNSEAIAHNYPYHVNHSIFRFYIGRGFVIALPLMIIVVLGRTPIAVWLKIPPSAVVVLAILLLLAIVRPIVAGQLQGQSQFIYFGLTRLVNALSRLGVAILLVSFYQGGLLSALTSIPIGGLLALLVGLVALGWNYWQKTPPLPRNFRHPLSQLMSAFLAFTAYMSLLSMDLIWVNKIFAAEVSGAYATAVLLRRVLVLLPGAVIVVMYPQAVAQVARRQIPDKLLIQTVAIVILPSLLLTVVYTQFGSTIIRWTFGADYSQAASFLPGMSLGMIGFGLTAIWLNFYLATRPFPFVSLLVIIALSRFIFFGYYHVTLGNIALIFSLSGWFTAFGGFLIYVIWLRPSLKKEALKPNAIFDQQRSTFPHV